MDRRDSCLPEVEETRADAVPASAQGINASRVHRVTEPPGEPEAKKHYRTIPPTAYQRPAGVSYLELQKQARRAKRYARYEDVRTLSGQGVSIREIARRLKLSRETIRRFLRAEAFPEMASGRRSQRGSILNPYKPYILQRCRASMQEQRPTL
jgi:hypothetical protein